MDIIEIAKKRHTCKAYDEKRRLSADLVAQLKQLLVLSPSSINAQPWHFLVISSQQAKQELAQCVLGMNYHRVEKASHVFVLCALSPLPQEHLLAVSQQEKQDLRGRPAKTTEEIFALRYHHYKARQEQGNLDSWVTDQVFINLGFFLLGAAALGVDATAIGGFYQEKVIEKFDLLAKGLKPIVLVATGYRSEEDYNAVYNKSRLSVSELFTEY